MNKEVKKEEKTDELKNSLRRSEGQLKTLIQTLPDLIWLKDNEGVYLSCNKMFESFFGASEAEIVGKTDYDFVEPELADFFRMNDRKAAEAGKATMNEEWITFADGHRALLETIKTPMFDSDGNLIGILGIGHDITKRKMTEEALLKAKEEAVSADKLKSAFLATMSHELRTPLNSIIGFSGIMLQEIPGTLNHEQKKQLTMIVNSGRHLLTLINDILDLSKIEAGQLTTNFEYFNLDEVLEEIIRMEEPAANNKGIGLRLTNLPGVSVFCDKQRLKQVLLNIIGNAIKFTQHGSVTIDSSLEKDKIKIKIIDTGIGIKKEDFHRLFDPFVRIESHLTRKYEGSGLGLNICKKLMNLLQGTINVESEFGRGSTFTVTLPVAGKSFDEEV